jgi:hypothetical protein
MSGTDPSAAAVAAAGRRVHFEQVPVMVTDAIRMVALGDGAGKATSRLASLFLEPRERIARAPVKA